MRSRGFYRPPPPGGGFFLGGEVPRDLLWLLGVVFALFSFQFFAATASLPALLRLTPAVWRLGFLWQLVTYPFAGVGGPSIWFVLELFILYLFGRTVFLQLGRRRFWRLLVGVGGAAGLAAAVVQLLLGGVLSTPAPFLLMQGQRMLLTVLVAAFATLNRDAVILLMFVLPIRARWFLLLEVLFAFLGFLGSRDLAGFVGLCSGVGVTYFWLSGTPARRLGRDLWLELQRLWLRWRLGWLRRRRGIRVVPSRGQRRDPWIH